MTDRIYLSSPDVTSLEEEALVRAIRSGWVAPLGPEVDAFEAELQELNQREHAVALSSGTAALHLALLTAGIGEGDLVLTSSLTFAATTNAIVYTGAEPVLIDCDETGNMSPAMLEAALDTLRSEGRSVKAIVPVDLLGKVVDHARIQEIADTYDAIVISDAAESLGAVRDGRAAGSFGQAAIVSFNGNKIMTTSGGGALLTNDETVAQRARYLATQARQPVVHYEHTDIGYNYRLSNLLAALGRAQLVRLPEMMERRRQIRLRYREFFADVPGIELFGEPSGVDGGATSDNFWLTSILIDSAQAGITPEDVRLALAAESIEARPLWKPMHVQPVHLNRRAFVDGTAEHLFNTGLSLPSGSALVDEELNRVTTVLSRVLKRQVT